MDSYGIAGCKKHHLSPFVTKLLLLNTNIRPICLQYSHCMLIVLNMEFILADVGPELVLITAYKVYCPLC